VLREPRSAGREGDDGLEVVLREERPSRDRANDRESGRMGAHAPLNRRGNGNGRKVGLAERNPWLADFLADGTEKDLDADKDIAIAVS